jgi:hypothetical protein
MKIKYILYGLIIIALTIILIGFIVRYPSYTIQTTGKLYIIKKSEDVTVLIYIAEELATVAINIESHGAAKVVGQDKIAIANYNTTKDTLAFAFSTQNQYS